jgi:hypothetical protein
LAAFCRNQILFDYWEFYSEAGSNPVEAEILLVPKCHYYHSGTAWTSFSEVMGMPANQITTAYWFSWYNKFDPYVK